MSTHPLRLPILRRALPAALLTAGLVLGEMGGSGSFAAAATTDAWASPSGGNGNALTDPGEASITQNTAPRVAQAWTTSWSNYGPTAPTAVGGVVYYLHRFINTSDPNALVAASTTTGKTLWQVPLSFTNHWWFQDGVTVSGHLAVMSFQEPGTFGAGLIAVDTMTHKIAWTRTLPDTAEQYGWSSHQVYADGTRAYVHLSDDTLSAYRLSDGKAQWTIPLASTLHVGVALGAGLLYVGYDPQTPGITAYDSATGRKLWTAPGAGTPVVAGGRVFSAVYPTLVAVNAAGCGKASCPALWKKAFPARSPRYIEVGAADANSVFVTYQRETPDGSGFYPGVITRLSAATGAQQWTTTIGTYVSPPVRGGGVLWVVNEYRDATSFGGISDRILAFAATGSRTTPLRSIPAPQRGFPQSLSVGGGAVFDQTNASPLVAYRVPGA